MAISQGDKLPDAVLRRMGDNGPEEMTIEALTAGRKIVLFGLPGAFTPTCSSAHVPSFIRTRDAFAEQGIEEIICVSVNDVHIMRQWGEATGATAAGLSMWADGHWHEFRRGSARVLRALVALCDDRGRWCRDPAQPRNPRRHLRYFQRRDLVGKPRLDQHISCKINWLRHPFARPV